ncbi:MAG: TolC family protein [Planctomycetota bacterium]|nr:MAG: TolC family protein [Planctomycetota bacterium]
MRSSVRGPLLALAFAPLLASAQEDASPGQGDPRAPAPPEDGVEVERPAELERIKKELARIKQERERLGGQAPPRALGPEVRALGREELSPVLAPRREVVGLRLREAIRLALANNPDYVVQLAAARSAHEGVPQERAAFDPVLSSTATYGRGFVPRDFGSFFGQTQVRSRTLNISTSLALRLQTGTQLTLTHTELRTESTSPISGSKNYLPSLRLDITQPLLRDFGIETNLTPLRLAQNAAFASDATLAETYMAAVLAVEQAYWDLVLAEEQLRAQERSLSSSLKFLDDQRKKLQHGAGTRLEVTIAKAGVATAREAVIAAENGLEAARDQIIRLTSPSTDLADWDRFVVPLDQPLLLESAEQDPAEAIQTALRRRPDYLRAQLDLDSAQRNLSLAENQRLPRLDAIGSFSEEGLGTGHRSAWSSLGSGDNYSWEVGVRVELPLFLRAERARVRAARHDLEGAQAALRALEATVVLEVRGALRDVRTAKARIEAARASRVLAKERLDATRVQVETGTAVPRDVLDDLAELARAETNEVQAFINYRLALSRLALAQGTLLDDWLDELDPRVRAAIERRPLRD